MKDETRVLIMTILLLTVVLGSLAIIYERRVAEYNTCVEYTHNPEICRDVH